jgi:hypothetical protein
MAGLVSSEDPYSIPERLTLLLSLNYLALDSYVT